MPIMSQPAFGPKLSIGYITGGAIAVVLTLVWRFTVKADQDLGRYESFFFWGVLSVGAVVLLIGAFLGSIGRAARKVELPPTDDTARAEANVQANLAANAPGLTAGAAVAPGMMPGAVPGAVPPGAVLPGTAMPAAPAAPAAPAYRR